VIRVSTEPPDPAFADIRADDQRQIMRPFTNVDELSPPV
jgi:hypothetical protein